MCVYVYMGKDSVQVHLCVLGVCVCVREREFVLFTNVHILTHKTENTYHKKGGMMHEEQQMQTSATENQQTKTPRLNAQSIVCHM
jgi:hypothetical protein